MRSLAGSYRTGAPELLFGQLDSTLGRIFARMLETKLIADPAGEPLVQVDVNHAYR